MKIAILSDIHGNMPALEAVAEHIAGWRPDLVVVNGDIVNRGPCSVTCWQFVQQQPDWVVLRGNHEEYVLGHLVPDAPRDGLAAPSFWVFEQFGGAVAPLAALPTLLHFNLPEGSDPTLLSDVAVTHASLNGRRDGIYPERGVDQVRGQIRLAEAKTAVFVTSHTHLPAIYDIDGTLLVNTGSAGQNCDGDVRASYAQLVARQGQWTAEIVRLPYDRAQTERDFWQSGFMTETGPAAPLIYHEWRTAEDVVVSWMETYWTAVLAGEIGWETAVAEHVRRFSGQ